MCSKCNPMRSGASWDGLLARHRLVGICDSRDGWTVQSASGGTYHVRSIMGVDRESGAYTFRMTCDCPARKQCRHIDAVMDMRHAEELAAARCGDPDGIEIIERTM